MNKHKKFLNKIFEPFKFKSGKGEGQDEEDLGKIAAQEQKQFPYQVLVSATKDFHPTHKLGEGGFGPVYKGKLNDGKDIAVKRLSHNSNQGPREFMNEAKLLARVQHRNIVNLVGYCVHGADEKLLVYEYVANESLDKLLFSKSESDSKREVLDWKLRLDIIIGVARGLLYLHEGSHNCIVHRDIKASNILLDEKWVPKIADFGMARLFREDQSHVQTRVAGTNGYMAPEYVMHGELSVKADVYSFGVLMLEIISGQKNSSFNLQADAQNLLDWAYKLHKKGRSLEVMERALATSAIPDQVAVCLQIGLLCAQSDPQLRPTMQRVLVMLSKRPGNLEEPTRPGLPGSRYRRSRRAATATASSSGGTSASHTFETSSGTGTGTTTATTSAVSLPNLDPHGKRPMEQ